VFDFALQKYAVANVGLNWHRREKQVSAFTKSLGPK